MSNEQLKDTLAEFLENNKKKRVYNLNFKDIELIIDGETEQTDAIQPDHYRKNDMDLYESAYLTRPFNEVRAILEFVAERYIKRDKNDRVEDIRKGVYTLERLIEYELKEMDK